jgi:AraC-type DNA-binding domain-containing proteins
MEEILLKEGEYIFLDSNTPHQLEVTKESPCRILNLEIGRTEKRNGFELSRFAGISDSLRELLDTPRHALRASDHSGSLCHIITELQKQFVNRLDQSEYNIESDLLLSQLFIEMSRQINRKQISFRGSIYVKRALQYIDKNYERDLTVEEISDYSGISLSYMQKLFKEQTGISLIDKINAFRIEKAKLLLETSSLPVIDIAVTVGFHNRQHFTYIFTKITGCSPSLYRKQKGNNQLFLGFH